MAEITLALAPYAPPRAYPIAERIASLLGAAGAAAARQSAASIATPVPAPGGGVIEHRGSEAPARTTTAMVTTGNERRPRRAPAVAFVLVGLVGLAAIGTGMFVLVRRASRMDPGAAGIVPPAEPAAAASPRSSAATTETVAGAAPSAASASQPAQGSAEAALPASSSSARSVIAPGPHAQTQDDTLYEDAARKPDDALYEEETVYGEDKPASPKKSPVPGKRSP